MELHQLRCFLLVVEEGGFKRATARLGITQPALSYLIKQLEDELRVPLFHRRPRSVVPTEAGRVLVAHAERIVGAVHAAHQAVRELADGITGDIRIGTVNSVGTHFLPQVLWRVHSRCPAVHPVLVYRASHELVEMLLAGKLDVALAADPEPDPRLRFTHVADDPISLVCAKSHPFFGRPTVKPADLAAARFIALDPSTPTGALAERYLERQGVALAPIVSTDNVEAVKRMVEEEMGVALLPDMVTADDVGCDGSEGKLWRSALEPPLVRRIVLAAWREAPRSRAVDAFVEEVRRFGRTWRGCRS